MKKLLLGAAFAALLVGVALAASPVTVTTTTTNSFGNTQDTPISSTNPLPVSTTAPTGNMTNKSGAITLGGTAQSLAASNTSRKRIIIENPCTAASQGIAVAESLFVDFTGTAVVNSTSIELAPCGSFDPGAGAVSTQAISVIAATTSHKWIAMEQ